MLQLMLLQIELLPPQLKSDLASFTNFILDCTAHAIAEKAGGRADEDRGCSLGLNSGTGGYDWRSANMFPLRCT